MQSMLAKLPGSTYLPTKSNRVVWKLAREISSLVKKVVKERTNREKEEKDLLQSILKNSKEERVEESFIVDNSTITIKKSSKGFCTDTPKPILNIWFTI